MSFLYRTRQFWSALTAIPAEDDLVQAGKVLSPGLFQLFQRMQPGEQAHSLAVFRRLREQGEMDRDLWVAALLHDVGKSCHPLRIWDRAAIVIVQLLLPQRAKAWGQCQPAGWKRPFVVAERHPEWGAQLAAQAGASPTTIELIRRHQEQSPPPGAVGFERLLLRLQSVDNER